MVSLLDIDRDTGRGGAGGLLGLDMPRIQQPDERTVDQGQALAQTYNAVTDAMRRQTSSGGGVLDAAPIWPTDNPVGTERYGGQELRNPDPGFRPAVMLGGGMWGAERPTSQAAVDQFGEGSKWLYDQASLLVGNSPVAGAPRAVMAASRRTPLTPVPAGRGGAMVSDMGTTAPKVLPESLYHVAHPDWVPGQPLRSLYSRFGDEAYDRFAERWPEAGELGQYHPHYVMFYDDLEAARAHPADGRVLQVDPRAIERGLRFDELERPGFWVTSGEVPPHAIKEVPAEAPPGIRAYHGSPHSFDRFDSSRIGTGEGAQAYGHGLYFAENEGVARQYRDNLSPLASAARGNTDAAGLAARALQGASPEEAIAGLQARLEMPHIKRGIETGDAEMVSFRDNIAQAIELIRNPAQRGSMYEAQINADPEHFLHWDKPLSEQSALNSVSSHLQKNKLDPSKTTGLDLYRSLMEEARFYGDKNPAASAAKELSQRGIPGIRYLDQGSRGAGEGSHNLVVFDDATIEILRKYGLAALLLGGGGAAAGSRQQPQQ